MMEASAVTIPISETENLRGFAPVPKKSRQSLKQRLRQVSEDHPPSKSFRGFISAIIEAGSEFLSLIVICAVSNCVAIVTIMVGSYFHDESYCPVERISILLIMGGSITLVLGLLETFSNCCSIDEVKEIGSDGMDQVKGTRAPEWLSSTMSTFKIASLCWVIIAANKIYSVWPIVSEDKHSENYCHPELYLFAFCIVTLGVITLVVSVGALCLLICLGCVACCGNINSKQLHGESSQYRH